jgi:hypothetical protein
MTVGALPEVGNDDGFSGRGLIALGSAQDNLVHDMSVRTPSFGRHGMPNERRKGV